MGVLGLDIARALCMGFPLPGGGAGDNAVGVLSDMKASSAPLNNYIGTLALLFTNYFRLRLPLARPFRLLALFTATWCQAVRLRSVVSVTLAVSVPLLTGSTGTTQDCLNRVDCGLVAEACRHLIGWYLDALGEVVSSPMTQNPSGRSEGS